jgi:hypothetical protein
MVSGDVGESPVRRQVTVFADGAVGTDIARLRRRWDPVMAERIGPHVTVVYEVDDDLLERLDTVASSTPPFTLELERPQCWGGPAGGIYFPVVDEAGALDELRARLGAVAPAGVTYRPHVTITHPRTTPADRALAAWAGLADLSVPGRWTVRELCVVTFVGEHWEIVQRAGLEAR